MTIEHEMRALMARTPEQYRRNNDAVARRIAQHFADLDRAEPANKTLAQRGADQPLLPKAPQRPANELGDLPLFGDSHKQLDLIDAIRGIK